MLFSGFESLVRVIVAGLLAYVWLIFVLRVAGKRSLSKLNAFDFVITVAFGSTLATVLLSAQVSLADGALGIGLLAGLQFAASKLSLMSGRFRRMVRSEPTLMVEHGEMLARAMAHERVTRGDLEAALRAHGIARFEQVRALVLETDGSFSVIRNGEGTADTLGSVRRIP